MKRHETVMIAIVVLGLACAVQSSRGGELPEEIKQFAAEQHEQILLQGREARQAMRKEVEVSLAREYWATRMAFMESQRRSILNQGKAALAAIQERQRPVGLAGRSVEWRKRIATQFALPSVLELQRLSAALRVRDAPRLVSLEELDAWTQPGRMEAARPPLSAAGYPGHGS